jgi:hypothetical protein
MKRRVVDLGSRDRLLEIVSYGRGAAGVRSRSTTDTPTRAGGTTPEVIVKVSGGARSLKGVASHVAYVGRRGRVSLESDTGDLIDGKRCQHDLVDDWDLDLELGMPSRFVREPAKPAKLVHNLIFSMPPGTPPEKVLKAVKNLARDEWALKHRYALVLHTDEPHPHVHVILKARSEQGVRLNIKKAMLRDWRQKFASNLLDIGVAATATHRASEGSRTIDMSGRAYHLRRQEVI